jgi:hypothetical protein
MKFSMSLMSGLLAVQFPIAVTSSSVSKNPLGEVLDLLADLSVKITNDGAAESAAFKEYTAWCKDVQTNKGFEITTATSQKDKLGASIVDQTAKIEESSSAIERLGGDIASATTDLKNAASIRAKEATDFAAGEKELSEVIDTLARAVTILDREMQKNPAAFAQFNIADSKSVLESLGAVVDAAAFSASDKGQLLAFVQSQEGSAEDDAELGAPSSAVYKTHSSSIFDVLEDLKDKAATQLSDLRKSEVNAKHNFEMLKQSLEDQVAADTKEMDGEKSLKAATSESKATAEGDLEVTMEDLKTAKQALATATSTCKQVADNHEASTKSRDEELKTIADATSVLKSSTGGAVSQTYSFLDVVAASNLRSRSDLSKSEVIVLIKNLARKQHSAALAQLASRIASVVRFGAHTGEDPFAKVKGLIQDMLAKLQAEAGADATEKAYCDEELAKTAAKTEELGAEIGKLSSKIETATARSAELKEDVRQLQSELATMAKEQAQMDALRQKTHTDYVQAKADLEQGLAGVRRALVILREYYAQKDETASFAQQPAMPGQHSQAAGSATSIIGILEVVETDFATNLAKEETEEAEAQDSYEAVSQENKITNASKDGDVKYKTKEITSLRNTLAELKSDRDTANTEAAAVLEYDTQLKGRCIAKPETYESRKQRREAELAGLKEALSILEDEGSFLQKRKRRARLMRGAL